MASPSSKVLSRDEVEKIIQSILEEQNIKNPIVHIDTGSSKGDGYMSFLTKVDVISNDGRVLNLIIKVAPKNKELRLAMPLRDLFVREICFYKTIPEKFENFQKQRGVLTSLLSIPKCYKTLDEDENEMLIMDNVKLQGYRMWNRKTQMDEDHINMVFKQYAKFHALSYAMKNLNPDMFQEITKNIKYQVFNSGNMSPGHYKKFFANSKDVLDSISSGLDKNICNAIDRYLEGLEDFFVSLENVQDKYPVITHGDCWCNNMMFKYEDDGGTGAKPINMMFLDFQLCLLASPMRDLCYFFHVSASKSVLYNYKHHINIYYEELKSSYLELGGDLRDLLTYNDLLSEWKYYAKLGLTLALFIFKAMMCDDEEILDMVEMKENNLDAMDYFQREMKNDNITKEMTKTLVVYMYDNDLF